MICYCSNRSYTFKSVFQLPRAAGLRREGRPPKFGTIRRISEHRLPLPREAAATLSLGFNGFDNNLRNFW